MQELLSKLFWAFKNEAGRDSLDECTTLANKVNFMYLTELFSTLFKMDDVRNNGGSSRSDVPSAQTSFLNVIKNYFFLDDGASTLVTDALGFAFAAAHVMPPSQGRLLQGAPCGKNPKGYQVQ